MRLFYFILLTMGLCWGGTCALYNYESYPFTAPEILFYKEIENATALTNSTVTNPTIQKGKRLFKLNCANCHNKNMRDDLTGPALKGVTRRWEGRETLLYYWIRNSQMVIQSGDSYSIEIFKNWAKATMPSFSSLTTEDISAILQYIESH